MTGNRQESVQSTLITLARLSDYAEPLADLPDLTNSGRFTAP